MSLHQSWECFVLFYSFYSFIVFYSTRPQTKRQTFFFFRLVSLKLLNSIVLLGKSCVYVKRAKMEDQLFERPPTTPSSSKKEPRKPDKNRGHTPSGKTFFFSELIILQTYIFYLHFELVSNSMSLNLNEVPQNYIILIIYIKEISTIFIIMHQMNVKTM